MPFGNPFFMKFVVKGRIVSTKCRCSIVHPQLRHQPVVTGSSISVEKVKHLRSRLRCPRYRWRRMRPLCTVEVDRPTLGIQYDDVPTICPTIRRRQMRTIPSNPKVRLVTLRITIIDPYHRPIRIIIIYHVVVTICLVRLQYRCNYQITLSRGLQLCLVKVIVPVKLHRRPPTGRLVLQQLGLSRPTQSSPCCHRRSISQFQRLRIQLNY